MQNRNVRSRIYFGGKDKAVTQRCRRNESTDKRLIAKLQPLLHSTHTYEIRLKCNREMIYEIPGDKVIITSDIGPIREHARRFNDPANNEVAMHLLIIWLLQNCTANETLLLLLTMINQLSYIKGIYLSPDCLRYELIFSYAEDCCHLNKCSTNLPINIKVSR